MNIKLLNTRFVDERPSVVVDDCFYIGDDDHINESDTAVKIIEDAFYISSFTEEVAIMLCMDIKNKIIGGFLISKGSAYQTIMNPREILMKSLLVGASKIIIAHNHPSQVSEPSRIDEECYCRLLNACNVIGIRLSDCLIITENTYYSLVTQKEYKRER